ncbi:uncharacterized protein KY384_008504 [Bacidia gigantensis]|uniref:uncharacterized protein n=1 Tax=Bacidia gigantensis TaxID=2732470 RepID=UPI001D04F6E4|nr:uncharacterized protein KY384_008504 [Bacidia gigantensis]KAG8527075.1 hypothetical protein KY384_008504 [Bacidia gigantensis]
MSNPSVAGPHAQGDAQDNRGPALLGIVAIFTAISAIAVGSRLFVRLWILKNPGLDDAAISLSLILAIISTIAYGIAIENGYGRHIKYISKPDLGESIKWNLVATVAFYLSLIFSKISVCFLFLRIIGRTRTPHKVAFLYGMMALASVIGFIAAGYTAGQCQPVAKDWNHELPGKCHGDTSVKIGLAQGSINAFIDFSLATFPITFLLKSKMDIRRKVFIWALMSCGVIAGFCSIARIVVSSVLVNSGDFTYVETAGTYLAVAEEAASIVIACIPTLMPLIQVMRGKTVSGKSSKYGRSWPTKSSFAQHTAPDPYEMNTFVSAVPPGEKLQGAYGSDVDLVPGIEKITRIDVKKENVKDIEMV